MNTAVTRRLGRPYSVEKGSALEGLREERHRAGLEGSLARLVVAVSRQNDDRDARARGAQMPQEVETVHSGHPQIEHHAAGVLSMDSFQKGFRGLKRLDSEAH